jgi:hypothetical protein
VLLLVAVIGLYGQWHFVQWDSYCRRSSKESKGLARYTPRVRHYGTWRFGHRGGPQHEFDVRIAWGRRRTGCDWCSGGCHCVVDPNISAARRGVNVGRSGPSPQTSIGCCLVRGVGSLFSWVDVSL